MPVVGYDGDARSLGYVAYLHEGRQASDPLDVGLEGVYDLVCGAGAEVVVGTMRPRLAVTRGHCMAR